MSDADEKQEIKADKMIGKKPFIEPEMKEFDDLEKQIKSPSPLIGQFSP